MKKPQDEHTATSPLERMASFTKKLVAVPREEIDAKARAYEKRKRERKQKAPQGEGG